MYCLWSKYFTCVKAKKVQCIVGRLENEMDIGRAKAEQENTDDLDIKDYQWAVK